MRYTLPRLSRDRLRLFAHQLRQLQRPLLQEADLAVCFVIALSAASDITSDIEEGSLKRDYRNFRNALIEFGGLEVFQEADKTIGYIAGMGGFPNPEEAICSLDPFVYVSHLSAMAWHSLTDRIPKTLYLTRPAANLWRSLADARLEAQLGDLLPLYLNAKMPRYQKIELARLKKRALHFWSSSRLDQAWHAAFKNVEGGSLRVATVGRCFLDMVREPELCGGIHHVMEVYEEHASTYASQIISTLNAHGNKLEQARAGYLLERADPTLEEHEVLNRWAAGASRGGSRKLDPSGDYSDHYSERWALSINV